MHPIRILLLEESDTYIHSLRDAVSKTKGVFCNPVQVKCLTEGIALMKRSEFDILFADLSLPDSQGVETFRALHRSCPNTPTVLLVSADEEDIGETVLQEGAQDYLVKEQVSGSSLLHSLKTAIERQEYFRKAQFQLRQLSAGREAIQEAERTRISRALHSDSEQLLIAIKIDLVGACSRLREESLEEKLREVQNLADRAIESIQKISIELRPSALDNLGLVEALGDEARRFERRTEIGVNFESPESIPKLHRDTVTALFRIFQELLDNIVHHAQASLVDVFLVVDGEIIELRVDDNGVGIDEDRIAQSASLGIPWMKERALYLGGEITFKDIPTGGTQVIVRVPFHLG